MTRYRHRMFVCTSQGEIRRFPVAKYDRLFAREDIAPEFGGKEIRFASVLVIEESGHVVGVMVRDAMRLRFDRTGKLSRAWYEAMMKASVELYSAYMAEQSVGKSLGNVLLAKHRFVKRRFDHGFHWRPTKGEKHEMIRLALKSL